MCSPSPFVWKSRTYIMGILNITPDSFSRDGLLSSGEMNSDVVRSALEQARRFISAGADILDVGGESTRPGAQPVSVDEEAARILPVIQTLIFETGGLVSVDTYKAEVAEAALQMGACMVNDVWGLRADPSLADVVARHKVPVVLMHNRAAWASPDIRRRLGEGLIGAPYQNLLEDVKRELLECVLLAHNAGIADDSIILDPGIGFGKTVEQNLELIDRLDEIRTLGYPVLLGPSRKSFIGLTLDLPTDQRLEGTAAAVAVGIARGADIVRVHDVEYISRVVQMTDAIVRRPNQH